MKKIIILSFISLIFNALSQSKIDVKRQFELASQQYEGMLKSHQDITKIPQSTLPDGKPRDMPIEWWCSGFFGGSLWYLFEQTKNLQWKLAAEKWAMAIEKERYNTHTHDLGFM